MLCALERRRSIDRIVMGFLLALFFAIQLHLHFVPVDIYFYRMTHATASTEHYMQDSLNMYLL